MYPRGKAWLDGLAAFHLDGVRAEKVLAQLLNSVSILEPQKHPGIWIHTAGRTQHLADLPVSAQRARKWLRLRGSAEAEGEETLVSRRLE